MNEVNQHLKREGLATWFDEDRMVGNVQLKMAEGIDNTATAVVFITKNYHDKANGNGPRKTNDNCFFEFSYISRKFEASRICVVVMEETMRDTSTWSGLVGAMLGGELYFDLSMDAGTPEFFTKCEELVGWINDRISEPI